ncbi:MAG: hypothetical protein DIZ80_03645 [endosymbiont of Galathealinum brachiosum]|uniref:GGDEF domain-containing protein n=1 Tax=endosymbiont of Galathealinum brachiosum TaxID=2200906 RepID=A0A370DI55_9GAMM|nr:MAG: hypothetical protein DIZ80_03645 [endosymbiont of Galathealinum brachiosum]
MIKKIDLTSQFIFYIAIILIGVIGSMNFWFYHDHTKHLTETLENKAVAKLDFLASSTGYYLKHFENELILELGKETMLTDHNVIFLSIKDTDGKILFEKGNPKQKDSRVFFRKITKDSNEFGSLTISLDIKQLIINQRYTMYYTIGLMVISVSLIGGMIYLFYRKKILHKINIINREKDFLRHEHDFFMSIINTASNMVIVLDRYGYIMLVNQTCATTLGNTLDELTEKHITSILDIDCGGQKLKSITLSDVESNFESFSENLICKDCKTLLNLNDTEIHIEWKFSKTSEKNGQVKFLTGTGIDITHQHQKQLELSHRAHYDHLTLLPNRILFNDRIQESFKQARRSNALFAVLFIDLDNFKPINDKYGHEAGDLVLKTVAQRMQSTIRELDTVARFGGDEFGMLVLDIKNRENITQLTEKLLRVISDPITYGEKMLNISASIGITFYNNEIKDTKELINQADTAMYEAKRSGRNKYCYFKLT